MFKTDEYFGGKVMSIAFNQETKLRQSVIWQKEITNSAPQSKKKEKDSFGNATKCVVCRTRNLV